jgi:hypothetical protein
VERLADVEIAIDGELCRRSALDIASCANNFYAGGERRVALLCFCFARGKSDNNDSDGESSKQQCANSGRTS